MLYIVTALKPEAQAFVDKYKLTKTKCADFTLFSSEELKIIISGIGVNNSKKAVEALIENFNLTDNDIIINTGICGADKKYKIGELIDIGSILYKEKKYIIDSNILNTITCKDVEVSKNLYNIADMESFGFYTASAKIKNRYIFKVVSDHFEPSKVTKEDTKKLIFGVIDDIFKKVKK